MSQRGAEDKILYNSYNRGAEITKVVTSEKPKINPLVDDNYRESKVDSDIVSIMEEDRLHEKMKMLWDNSKWGVLEQTDPDAIREIFNTQKFSDEMYSIFMMYVEFLRNEELSDYEIVLVFGDFFCVDYKILVDHIVPPSMLEEIMRVAKKKTVIPQQDTTIF